MTFAEFEKGYSLYIIFAGPVAQRTRQDMRDVGTPFIAVIDSARPVPVGCATITVTDDLASLRRLPYVDPYQFN